MTATRWTPPPLELTRLRRAHPGWRCWLAYDDSVVARFKADLRQGIQAATYEAAEAAITDWEIAHLGRKPA